VGNRKQIPLDFIVDKITNSIENVLTSDSFNTEVLLVTASDLKTVTKKMAGYSTGNMN
jgi:hypothetical protein